MSQREIFLNPDQGTRLRVLNDCVRILASGRETDGQYELFEVQGPEGSGPPPHTHPWAEAYFIVEGKVEVLIKNRTTTATPGCFAFIPRDTVHAFRVVSPTARFIVVTAKPGAAAFFTELEKEVPSMPPDMDAVLRVATRHGLTVAS